MRVLESLMPPPGTGAVGGPPGARRPQITEVVEGEESYQLDDEDEEFLAKKPGKKVWGIYLAAQTDVWRTLSDATCPPMQFMFGAQAGKKRKEKVTAEMRRKAALQRKLDREEKALGSQKEREEIFEVADLGCKEEWGIGDGGWDNLTDCACMRHSDGGWDHLTDCDRL